MRGAVTRAIGQVDHQVELPHAIERRMQVRDHVIVIRCDGAIDAATRLQRVLAQARAVRLHAANERRRHHHADIPVQKLRAHRGRQLNQLAQPRGAFITLEQMFFHRIRGGFIQLIEPIREQL